MTAPLPLEPAMDELNSVRMKLNPSIDHLKEKIVFLDELRSILPAKSAGIACMIQHDLKRLSTPMKGGK